MIHLPILELSCKQQKCVKDPSKNVNSSEDFLMLRLKFMKYLSMDTLESTHDCEELHESIFLPSDDRKEYSTGL